MVVQFSENGEYFAEISIDGKLKVWNTLTNSLEQEFTANFHLASPCTCLHFVEANSLKYKGASPKKKKRKYSGTNFGLNILLGTKSGLLSVYSISKANLEYTINSETSQSLTCLSSANYNEIYSGAEKNIFVWDLDKRKLVSKWKVGNERVSTILAIPESQQILTAAKNISLWDVTTKEVIRTFTGHSSEVTLLRFIAPQSNGDSYFISGSKDDKLLNCWSLSANSRDKNTVARFLMDDIIQSISVLIAADGSTNMAATVKNGVVHIYQHTLNGKCGKPIKPKTTIQIVSDPGHSEDSVTPIRIFGAIYRDDMSLCLAHGTENLLTFENVSIVSEKKIHCLVRKNPLTLALSKPDQYSKTITPTAKNRNNSQLEVSMETILENMKMNSLEDESSIPKLDNFSQLLVQGLHSKDRNIVETVLCESEEHIIKNTITQLPNTVIVPLIQELGGYIAEKNMKQRSILWLGHIMQIHAGILMSDPELPTILSPIQAIVEGELDTMTFRDQTQIRVVHIRQMISSQETDEIEQAVLNHTDYIDSDDEDIQIEVHSESENEWEKDSSEEKQIEENNRGSESESDSS